MDPHSVDSSLQKTLPELNPTAVYRLSTEVSAQANMLVTHQQQLACLTSLTEELVTTLQALQLSPSESAPPQPPVDPALQAPPLSKSTTSLRLAYLEKFDGTPSKCNFFCYNAPCLSHNNLCYIQLKKVVFPFYALS